MAMLILPRVQAMVLCDGLKESDVFNLIGVCAILEVSSFPAFHPRLVAYKQMSGHSGEASCHIEIERVETSELIYHSSAKSIKFVDPTRVVPVHFRARNCVFPAPGLYYVQVFSDGKLICERPLQVRQVR
jgi:hypothetical protein